VEPTGSVRLALSLLRKGKGGGFLEEPTGPLRRSGKPLKGGVWKIISDGDRPHTVRHDGKISANSEDDVKRSPGGPGGARKNRVISMRSRYL